MEKKHAKKSSYPKGSPSGARGTPTRAKGEGAGVGKDKEVVKNTRNVLAPGRKGKPFKRSDK